MSAVHPTKCSIELLVDSSAIGNTQQQKFIYHSRYSRSQEVAGRGWRGGGDVVVGGSGRGSESRGMTKRSINVNIHAVYQAR